MLTYALAFTYSTMNLMSTLLVKWPTVQSCEHGSSCLVQLLDAQQMVVSCGTLSTVMVLCVVFPPGDSVHLRILAVATMLLNIAFAMAGFWVSASAACSRLSLDLAQGLSLASGLVVSVAFAPQVCATYKARGHGSISYTYFTIQTGGCVLVVSFQFFGLHDSWPVWGPTMISGSMQGAILATGAYYRLCKREQEPVMARLAQPPLPAQSTHAQPLLLQQGG